MTVFTERADAVEAAIRDLARDIEADLGKLTRFRGRTGATSGPEFRDPGDNLTQYAQQKATFPGRVEHTLATYRPEVGAARDTAMSLPATEAGEHARLLELVELVQSIAAVQTHDDAAALVATFEEA